MQHKKSVKQNTKQKPAQQVTRTVQVSKSSQGVKSGTSLFGLRWWIWIIIIVGVIFIGGNVLVPILSAVGALGKMLGDIVGKGAQGLSWLASHPGLYWTAIGIYIMNAIGGFAFLKSTIGRLAFRKSGKGKSTTDLIKENKCDMESVKKTFDEKNKENKDKPQSEQKTQQELMIETIKEIISPVVNEFTKMTTVTKENAQELLNLINEIKANQEEGQVMDKEAEGNLEKMKERCENPPE